MKFCKFCMGKGRIICTTCHGTKKDPRNKRIECQTCSGKGYIECNGCLGTGKPMCG